jgi:hypothetical protein
MLFEIGRLSCGQAAELAGDFMRTFMDEIWVQSLAVIAGRWHFETI